MPHGTQARRLIGTRGGSHRSAESFLSQESLECVHRMLFGGSLEPF